MRGRGDGGTEKYDEGKEGNRERITIRGRNWENMDRWRGVMWENRRRGKERRSEKRRCSMGEGSKGMGRKRDG